MPYFYYGFDSTYLILVLPVLILSLVASLRVKSTFNKYATQLSSRGITGAQAAQRVLLANGITNVQIEHTSGSLTDHYDPRSNVIRLSDPVFNSTSTAAIGVACHEAGHAVQYALNYRPVKFRTAIIPITNIGSNLAMPFILIGLVITSLSDLSTFFIYLGIACFSLSLIFQLVTLPVEFNASRRAIQVIDKMDILNDDELIGAKKTLRAAAMTYVMATIAALTQLLRLFLLFGRRRRN